jgi:hypothetical protein
LGYPPFPFWDGAASQFPPDEMIVVVGCDKKGFWCFGVGCYDPGYVFSHCQFVRLLKPNVQVVGLHPCLTGITHMSYVNLAPLTGSVFSVPDHITGKMNLEIYLFGSPACLMLFLASILLMWLKVVWRYS